MNPKIVKQDQMMLFYKALHANRTQMLNVMADAVYMELHRMMAALMLGERFE